MAPCAALWCVVVWNPFVIWLYGRYKRPSHGIDRIGPRVGRDYGDLSEAASFMWRSPGSDGGRSRRSRLDGLRKAFATSRGMTMRNAGLRRRGLLQSYLDNKMKNVGYTIVDRR